jgi:putative DNA methylase
MYKIMDAQKKFIETNDFPVEQISNSSAKEKEGPGAPVIWRMIFWWTRKPLASTRAIIAGSLLPDGINSKEFIQAMMLDKKVTHRYNPVIPNKWKSYFEGKEILDPFSGFGSVALEAMRLGVKATAVDLLPPSYIFLKAILEYPFDYGEKIIDDIGRWGQWILNNLMNDQVVQQLYDPDTEAYVGSWKIKCPHCGKWTPLISSYWLSRVEAKKGKYEQLVWMTPNLGENGDITMTITDVSNTLDTLNGIRIEKNKIITEAGEVFDVPTPNIYARSERATCLNPTCNGNIRYIDTITGKHYIDKKKNPNKKQLEWYVKFALSKYHDGDTSLAMPTLFVKVRKIKKKLQFEQCANQDQKKLDIARQEIDNLRRQKDPDLPTEMLAPYGTQAIGGYLQPLNYGMKRWMDLFNPRQLLILVRSRPRNARKNSGHSATNHNSCKNNTNNNNLLVNPCFRDSFMFGHF